MTILYYPRGTRTDTAELLPRAAAQFAASRGRPCPNLTIARAPGGKPYFPAAPWLHCSVSHSGDIWLCACSDAPIGVDVQHIRPARTTALARRFFHPDETAWLEAHPDNFFLLWTAKEACVKRTGRGIDGEFSRFSVITDGRISCPIAGDTLRHLPFADDYVLALCGKAETPTLTKL